MSDTREETQEKRTRSRFPIRRELRYRLLEGDSTASAGVGETIDMGSGGVAFSIERPLEPGTLVQLSISWPVLLHNTCAMRLVVLGRVLRSGEERSVCTVDKYEFRTQARTAPVRPMPRPDASIFRWVAGARKETPRIATV